MTAKGSQLATLLLWICSEYRRLTQYYIPREMVVTRYFIITRRQFRNFPFRVVATLNNINFHRAKSSIAVYVLGGFGIMTYSTLYNLTDDKNGGATYNYQSIVNQFGAGGFTYSNRKAIRDRIEEYAGWDL